MLADPMRSLVDPMKTWANPRKPMEYSTRWEREGWVCIGHVDFMFFVSFLFALGTQRERIMW